MLFENKEPLLGYLDMEEKKIAQLENKQCNTLKVRVRVMILKVQTDTLSNKRYWSVKRDYPAAGAQDDAHKNSSHNTKNWCSPNSLQNAM